MSSSLIFQNLTHAVDYYGTATTEVKVTSDPRDSDCQRQQRGQTTTIISSSVADSTTHSSDAPKSPKPTILTRLYSAKSQASLKLKRLDSVKMAYLRTSFIFAFAVLITWIPSSINRLYSLTNDDRVSYQLSIASGCVLPLQGVWNAFIYFSTSWGTVRAEAKRLKIRILGKRQEQRSSIRLNHLADNTSQSA